ncbi:MAG: hypothetical protein IPI35_20205 [Deltaproteobacteria bacterium]|nr:hypothetical protein [Deltaproteobacteria bacterium]
MSRVQNGEVSLMAASSLDQGLLRPLLPAVRLSAKAILDDGVLDGEIIGPALRSDTTREAVHTLAALSASEDAALSALMADLGPHVGDALARARDGEQRPLVRGLRRRPAGSRRQAAHSVRQRWPHGPGAPRRPWPGHPLRQPAPRSPARRGRSPRA